MDFLVNDNACGAERTKVDIETPASLRRGANQAPAQQIGQRRVLDGADDLAPIQAESGEHFDQVKRPEIIDMLNGIVEEERPEWRPSARKMD
jgi:hypothetical protein